MFDEEKHRTHNSTYTQVGVQCFFESEVLNPSSVFLMKFSAKNPHLRVAAKRYKQAYDDPYNHRADTKTTRLLTSKQTFGRPILC